MTEQNIKTIHEALKNKSITSEALVEEAIEKAKKAQKELNAFVTICEDAKGAEVTDHPLSGIPCAIKDNLSTKDILSTGSSNTLKDYVPFFNATVVQKLLDAGAVNIGKTVLDELGMGATGTTGHTGIVHNPWNTEKIAGGSSAGSAAAVAAGIVPYALGSDTGDSIRKPAALCGIVGYKPTYGMVSRYGLFPFASSLDHVGVLARSVEDAAIVIDTIKGIDAHDMTSWDSSDIHLEEHLHDDVKEKKLCYFKELCEIENYQNPTQNLKEALANFKEMCGKAEELGITVEAVSFPRELLEALKSAYFCISCAEATSNYSNLTGIIFGPRGEGSSIEEMMKDHRTKGFSPLIKRRLIIGSYVLHKENQEKFYLNATRVRRRVVEECNRLFAQYDGIIAPCSGSVATNIFEAQDVMKSAEDNLLVALENNLVIGNFGGYPSITIPSGMIDNMPIGINITGKIMNDALVLNIASKLEETTGRKNQIAKGELE